MKHVSYSEIKLWNECPFKHKLVYIDKISGFEGNEYTCFGTALHSVCEFGVVGVLDKIDFEDHFQAVFEKELDGLPAKVVLRENLVEEMKNQAEPIHSQVLGALDKYFGDYEVHAVEEKLFEPITEFTDDTCEFKGFIDLVVKTSDDKYHILDWKTCSWGWNRQRRSEPMTTYQLTLYKNFYAKVSGGLYESMFGESVRQENQINQGQAVYMPGASCVIKATADIDLQKFRDLAAACSMKHMEYLGSLKVIETK